MNRSTHYREGGTDGELLGSLTQVEPDPVSSKSELDRMREKIHVYAVVRVDDFNAEFGDNAISIKEILPTMEEAIQEVERLNQLNADKECHYFWRMTRYFPHGRSTTDEATADSE